MIKSKKSYLILKNHIFLTTIIYIFFNFRAKNELSIK